MNEPWQEMIQIGGVPPWVHPLLAQNTKPMNLISGIIENLGNSLLSIVGALLLLVVGCIIAGIAKGITKKLLNNTSIDNKIAEWIAGDQPEGKAIPIEEWISSVVYWIVITFTVVAVLQMLQLEAVSAPLNNFLEVIFEYLPKVGGALLLLGLAWLIASIVKMVIMRALRAFNVDERLGQQVGSASSDTQSSTRSFSLSETIGNLLYWLIFLFFLPAILGTLGLQGTLEPVQQLLEDILDVLPDVFGAIIIAVAGWFVAQVVRRIVTNLLAATGTDQLGVRFGLRTTAEGQSLSWIIGTVVYVLILIPVAIAALNTLKINAISEPAIAMLNQILDALPKIFTAALILVIAYVLGQFVKDLVTSILTSIGFNNVFQWLGVTSVRSYRTPTPPPADLQEPGVGQQTVLQSDTPTTRTPSEIVGIVALVAILLFATVASTNVLQFQALTTIVTGILVIFGQILAGLVVFAIGLYLANLAFNLITSSGSRQSRILGQTARIAIIALVSAMALQQMGIASDIVNLAFGLLLGAIAVAIALAFGLGARDIAAGQVREWLTSFKEDRHSGHE